jgi:hypothetical protein
MNDPAAIDIARGWCRAMGLTPMTLWLATAIAARNLAVANVFCARQEEARRRPPPGGSRTAASHPTNPTHHAR